MGLDAFNELPTRRAVHALFECCNSVTMAADLAKGRPYADHDALYRRADALLFAQSEESVDDILQAYPEVGSRPGSARSHAEQCALFDSRPGVMQLLDSSARGYAERFGFGFLMYVPADCPVSSVIAAIVDRMHNDTETERKVLRNEIAKINRSRLERMLGPESGFNNWV
jgi:2-oxo-4-hydroxy-4-carboxy-5-ureidoimidazoline decarboxylase